MEGLKRRVYELKPPLPGKLDQNSIAQGGCENGCVYILFSELLLEHSHVFILVLDRGTVHEVTTSIIRLLLKEGQFSSKLLKTVVLDSHQLFSRLMTIMTLPCILLASYRHENV